MSGHNNYANSYTTNSLQAADMAEWLRHWTQDLDTVGSNPSSDSNLLPPLLGLWVVGSVSSSSTLRMRRRTEALCADTDQSLEPLSLKATGTLISP